MLLAELPSTITQGASPTFVAVCGFIGIGAAAMAAAYTQFRTAALKVNQAQLNLANQGCTDRVERLEAKIEDLESRLREAEKREKVWQTRYEILVAKSQSLPSFSPPKRENE